MIGQRNMKALILAFKLDRVALLVADPPDTHLLSGTGDLMLNSSLLL